jgi:hypothetical protein
MEISIIPKWILKYFSDDYFRQNDISILASNILIIVTFLLFKNSVIGILNLLPHFCLIDKLFSVECPFCGTTRAFCELANGNINKALILSFPSLFVALFFSLQIPLRLISLLKGSFHTKINILSKYLGGIILLLILTSWVINLFIKN